MAKAKPSPLEVLRAMPKRRACGQVPWAEMLAADNRNWFLEFIAEIKKLDRIDRPCLNDILAAVDANIGTAPSERTLRKLLTQ